jgi:deoxyribodipyrimidine photo-lyase
MAQLRGSPSVDASRIQVLNHKKMVPGDYVLYWMQQSQRAEENHALEYAIELANHLDLPLLVVFGLTGAYPEANLRHYRFMLEGLRETVTTLAERRIKTIVRTGEPPAVALSLGKNAAVIVCDRGYLRHQRRWRQKVAVKAACRVVQVESDVIVPLEVVSHKAEYAARTIRPKILRKLGVYLTPFQETDLQRDSTTLDVEGIDLDPVDSLLERMELDRSVGPVNRFFAGGTRQAKKRFDQFVDQRLKEYSNHSNQPQTDDISHMSPYLHFGQVSSLYLALTVKAAGEKSRVKADEVAAFLEQLIVRRELAINFVYFTPDYDKYTCIPGWARQSLAEHAADPRPHRYSPRQLEGAKTHDEYWNAAMREMKNTGFMHNYMRMYWGKKILEWSPTPERAFKTTLALNNKYFLDGRDPNSYTGVAWIYGVHDRAWQERPIFGKVRYMAATGLERKCDIAAYVKKVEKPAGTQ